MARIFLRVVAGAAGLLLVLFLYGVGVYAPLFDGFAETSLTREFPPRAPVGNRPARRALLVSVDGLAPRVLATTPTPTIDRLIAEGSSAERAHTVMPSITMTAHTTMLTGVGPDLHGVRFNRYQPWRGVGAPSIFDRCAEAGLRCGLFAGKRKFFHFVRDSPGAARYELGADAAAVLGAAAAWIEETDPDFVMVHLAEVDRTGHEFGWGSAEQRAAIREIDARLEGFLSRVQVASPRPLGLLLTSDHGGHGTRHGSDRPDDLDIPWILHGDGVAPPRVTEASALDTAPTLLAILELERASHSNGADPLPGTSRAVPLGEDVSRPRSRASEAARARPDRDR